MLPTAKATEKPFLKFDTTANLKVQTSESNVTIVKSKLKDSLVRATAKSMNIDIKYVAVSALDVTILVRRFLVAAPKHLQGTFNYAVKSTTTVNVPIDPNVNPATAYTALSNTFKMSQQAGFYQSNVTVVLGAAYTVSDVALTVAPGPSFSPSLAPSTATLAPTSEAASSSGFPGWAIAIIVIVVLLGVAAIVAYKYGYFGANKVTPAEEGETNVGP